MIHTYFFKYLSFILSVKGIIQFNISKIMTRFYN